MWGIAAKRLAHRKAFAGIAQLVEQLICNQQVVGSSPTAGSILMEILVSEALGERKLMKAHLFRVSLLGVALFSGKLYSAEMEKPTVYLWPSKVEEFKGKSIEEVSSRKQGNVTRLSKILSPSITFYPAVASDKPAPVVLVCPGGGYSILAIDKEGTEVADWLNRIGISAVVLKYSVPNKRAEALQDIQRAMGVVRKNAKNWNIDPNKVGVLGFSAGGHLAAALSHHFENRNYTPIDDADQLSCKPDFCMLIYPAWLEPETVTENHPPAFVLQTKDDSLVKTTIPYVEALKAKNVPTEFHLFDVGGHGYGMRPSDHPVSKWPGLCETWIKETLARLDKKEK